MADGGLKLILEMCKNCKTGNKMIACLTRTVQYGRGTRSKQESEDVQQNEDDNSSQASGNEKGR